ncbi:DUF2059 domain-containing protein [Celeribacter sp.]|uniref:DUF2059 domain-containing protein n=1 Tax=Celeribacter sp. TaxID=1890673 RepID=UPI003A936A65
MTRAMPDRHSSLHRLKPILAVVMAALMVFAIARPAKAAGQGYEALFDAMRLDEMVEVLASEGRSVSPDFEAQGSMIPRAAWAAMLNALYRDDTMKDAFQAELTAALEGADIVPMIAFFESPLGMKVSTLELDARRAMSGDDARDMAAQAWAEIDPDSTRARLIEDYVEVYDMVEMNVAGAMTSDYAYLSALSQGGAGEEQGLLSDEDILREIWAYEGDVRAEVSEWVYGFSTLAYEPLSDDEFEELLAFARTPAGQKLNYALFAAFDAVYTDISRALGAGTAQLLSQFDGEEL